MSKTRFLFLTLLALCMPSIAVGQSLNVGVAESDITPPKGFPMAGYYHERLAEGQIDPLKAKATVFRQDDRSAAFVVVDITGIGRDLCVEVRRQAAAATGISEEHIVVSATHSHTAPDYTHHLYDYLGKKIEDRDENSYPAKLIQGCVDAIIDANKSAKPSVIKSGTGQQEEPVAFNRRFVMKDGSVKTWQSHSNPNVVRAAGPIDPEIGLVTIQPEDSKQTTGVLSNFALHLDTVGGLRWSADFPYFIEQGLRTRFGEETVSVFGLGCCGDINHSNPNSTSRNKTDVIGKSLAATIDATLTSLQPVDSPVFQVRTTTVDLPLQEVTQNDLTRAIELIPIAKAGGKVNFFDLVRAYKAVVLEQLQAEKPRVDFEKYLSWGISHAWNSIGKTLPAEVTTMTIGSDVAIVFLPGEVFVELGLAIKQGSPYSTTLVIELSNCVETMYVPNRAAYAGGSYEVTNSSLQAGAGEMLVEAALKLLRESAEAPPAVVAEIPSNDETTVDLQLTLPPAIYAAAGVPTSIFFDNIVLSESSQDYAFEVTCNIGTSGKLKWEATPTAADVGEHSLTVAIRDAGGKLLDSKSTVLNVIPANAGAKKDGEISLLIIGDSLTHATAYPNEIASLLSRDGNPKWNMLGTHKPASAAEGVAHEGYGGWTWGRFASHYEPNPDGTYKKRSSPFVYMNEATGKPELNVPRYFEEHFDGKRPDYVVVMLGVNDCFHPPADDTAKVEATIDRMFVNADTLLAALRKTAPDAEIGVCLTAPGNSRDEAFEANYKGRYPRWGWKRIQHRLVQRQLEYIPARQDAKITMIPTQLNIDPTDGYPADNSVHPNAAGYKQIGGSIYSWLKWRLNQ